MASRLSKITGVQQDIVDLTEGWMHARAGNHAKAAEALRRPAGRADAPEHIRGRARMLRSEALARSGQLDQALAALTEDHGMLYQLVAQRKGALSTDLWEAYLQRCSRANRKPIASRTFSGYVSQLVRMGLLSCERARVKGNIRLLKLVKQ